MSLHARSAAVTVLALVLAGSASLLAHAPRAEAGQGLSARVYLVQKRIPRDLSARALLQFVRKHGTSRLRETTGEPVAERSWRAKLVLAFNQPVASRELNVLFYDVTDKRRFVGPALTVFIHDPSDRTLVQTLDLTRPRFAPNRKMELVVTVRHREVAKHRFELIGERVRHSGKVDFSDDDAR
ncbi:MAG: hypothetical protein KC543_12855 [Myxococcales bacterium]|nr:hypothetical protein [Myxococcales bacterium]